MDKEMKMMFNGILEEMSMIEERTNKRFDKIEARLEIMQHEVNACKLERRIVELEKKSA